MVVIFDKYNTLYRKKSINLDEKEYLCTALITLRIMKKEWNDVREFHEKFGHPVAEEPRMIDRNRSLSRGKWMN